MARRDESLLSLLPRLPWWISACLALVLFTALKFVIPSIAFKNPIFQGMALASPHFAWFTLFLLVPAVISAAHSFRKSRLLDRQSGIESIRSLSWKEFEELLAEAYRRSGYAVVENSSLGPDGGIDLTIMKGGDRYLVQCKQWRSSKVGVSVVREMLGLVTAECASGGIIVTSGMFTQEAKNFAVGKPLDLVEGHQLVDLVGNVQASPKAVRSEETVRAPKTCPNCGGVMVLREAKRGPHAGTKFWGCASYPHCRHTEECRM